MDKPKNLKEFIKKQRKLNSKKNEGILPQEFIEKLYNSPEEFFSDFKTQIQNLLSENNKLFDSNQQSIFEIFLETYKKENNEIYENNFDLFFTELKDKLNILDRFEENFLIIYSKRLDKSFFFKIFFRLMKLGLLDENTVKQKNNLGNTCYSFIINELKGNYNKISKGNKLDEYVDFFNLFKTSFPNLFQEIDEESKFEINKLLIGLNLDRDNLSNLSVKEIIEKANAIFNNDFDLIHDVMYLKNISFNLLNYIIIRKDYNGAKELLNQFKNLSNLKNYSDCLLDNLFYILRNEEKNENYEDYLKNLIEIIQLSLTEEKDENKLLKYYQDPISEDNIYHLLFENKKMNSKEKREIYNILNEFLILKNETLIQNILSETNKNGYYPFNILLFNITFEEEDSEKLWDQILLDTMIEVKKAKKFVIIYHPTQYILDFLNNNDLKFQKIFEILMNKNLIDFFYVIPSLSKCSLLYISQHEGISKKVFELLINYFMNKISFEGNKNNLCILIKFIKKNVCHLNDESIIKILEYIKTQIEPKENRIKTLEDSENNFLEKCKAIDKKYNNKNLLNSNNSEIGEFMKEIKKYTELNPIENECFGLLLNLFFEKKFSKETYKNIYDTIISFIDDHKILLFLFKTFEFFESSDLLDYFISDLENIYKKLKLSDSYLNENNKYIIYSVILQLNQKTSSLLSLRSLKFYLCFIRGLDNSENLREIFNLLIFLNPLNLNAEFLPKFILKEDISNLKNIKSISFSNSLIYPIKIEEQILLLTSLFEPEIALKYYEDLFLKINLEVFTPYYNILKEIASINLNYKFKSFINYDEEKQKIINSFSKYKIPYLYLCCNNYVKKISYHYRFFSYFLYKITSMVNNVKRYEEIMKKEILVFMKQYKILEYKNYDFENEKGFVENFIIQYKVDLKKKRNEDQNLLYLIKNFINDTYKNEQFFFRFLSNPLINEFIKKFYKKENSEHLLYQYIILNIELNESTKQSIISFLPTNFISFINGADLLFSQFDIFISFNPFSFLLYRDLSDTTILNGYKTMLNEILKDNRIIKITDIKESKYNQFNKDLQNEIEKIRSPNNLDLFLKNFKIIQKDYIEFNDILKIPSFLDAFCYICYHLLKNKLKNKNIISFIEISLKFPLFENICLNLKFIDMFLSLSKNNFNYIMKNLFDEYTNIFYSEKFINSISDYKIDFETYQSILQKLISSLLEYNDLTLFDNFIKLLIKTPSNKKNFSVLLNGFSKNNFYSNLLLSYSIYKDDLNLFKDIMDILNLKPPGGKGKDLLLDNIMINSFYEYSFLKKRRNDFSIFMTLYNETIYFYLCLIASADNILNYINENYVTMNQIREIYKNINDIKFNLKKSIFVSKNVNLILEFNDILQFDSFDNNDYYLISTNYNDPKYYNSYIKAFSSLLNSFSFVKLFINCLEYSNDSLAKVLFDNFTNDEKEQLLNEKINDQNIILSIVSKNKFEYLKDLIPSIKSKRKVYNNLLSIYLNDDINNINQFKDKKTKNLIFEDKNYTINTIETPIYYSIQTNKFECFALLYDLYPNEYILNLFKKINDFSPRFLIKYFEYFSKEENKIKIKTFNSNLFIVSECLSSIIDFSNIQIKKCFQNLFGLFLSNKDTFSYEEVSLFIESNNLKLSFLLIYLLINIFKIYPNSSLFDFITNEKSSSFKPNEYNIIYILKLMNKEGHKILPVENYIEENFGDKFIPYSINKIKKLKEYEALIKNKNNNYKETENIASSIEKEPMKSLINCGGGYFRIGYIIFKEYNLLQSLKKLNFDERIMASYVLQNFNFLFLYQFYNYDYIKKDIGNL